MVTFIKAFCDRWDVEHNIVIPDRPSLAPTPTPTPTPETDTDGEPVPEPMITETVPEPIEELDDLTWFDSMDTPMPAPVPPVAVAPAGPVVPPMTVEPPPVASTPETAPPNVPDGDTYAIDDLNEI